MRAAVRVDDKKFSLALEDYEKALSSTPGGSQHVLMADKTQAADGCSIQLLWTAQKRVAGKDLIDDMLAAGDALVERARLLAGRALAHEGLSDWQAALDDYDLALSLAARGG